MSEWYLVNARTFIGCKSLCRLASSHSARTFDWRWSRKNEIKWTKVKRGEPKNSTKIHWGWGAGCEKSYMNPLHPFSLPILFNTSQPNSPLSQKNTPPFSFIMYLLNMIYWSSCMIHGYSPSKITQQSSQYLSWPTHTGPYGADLFFSRTATSTGFNVPALRQNSTGRGVLWHSQSITFWYSVGNKSWKAKNQGEAFAVLNIFVHSRKVFAFMYCSLRA